MALPSSGPLSLNDIQTEFGGTNPISLDEYYAGGAYVPAGTSGTYGAVPSSGTISIQNFYGTVKGFTFNATISSNTQNYNLRASAVSAGWNQTLPLIASVTVNSGVVVGSSSIATFAFSTGATFPTGTTLSLTNNGFIVGRGGNGPAGVGSGNGNPGTAGGPALQAQYAITIYNNGTVGGGGGGGGGGGAGRSVRFGWTAAGGGGGGGAGNTAGTPNGTTTAGGAGLVGGVFGAERGGTGGAGGNLGATGGTGQTGSGSGGGGTGGAGGAAGACTSGNVNITWAVIGTRLGTLG
jgi:hypothetical protein